jgi:phosphatidylglycerol---prolipoprotein diacylglyceryl transferase
MRGMGYWVWGTGNVPYALPCLPAGSTLHPTPFPMWSSLPSHLSPYIFQTPWFSLHWYGLMYVVAYGIIYFLAVDRIKRERFSITKNQLIDIMTWTIVGLAIGARLFYVIFYDASYYFAHPLEIILPIRDGVLVGFSGLSYHGGLIGIILAVYIYGRKNRVSLWKISDLLIPCIPLGYFFGRIGNFINGELYGRVTSMPWGMVFPSDPNHLLRHPSQLYEAGLEGLVLFAILWSLRKTLSGPRLLSVYLAGYAIARIIVEHFREPDPQLGFIFGNITMGQLLSAGMVFVAGYLWNKKYDTKH